MIGDKIVIIIFVYENTVPYRAIGHIVKVPSRVNIDKIRSEIINILHIFIKRF